MICRELLRRLEARILSGYRLPLSGATYDPGLESYRVDYSWVREGVSVEVTFLSERLQEVGHEGAGSV